MFGSSSSLAVSEDGHNISRHHSGLFKNLPTRISKQHLVEHKMFGSRRGMHGKDLKIGKKFRKKGKGVMKSMKNLSDFKSGGISPSVEEFDDMMSNVSGKMKKKSMLSRKSFG
jgi:hypothetical protein